MHTRMAWLALFLATGCASTRTRVMDASEAAALGPRAHVLSLNGEDAYGTIGKTDEGLALALRHFVSPGMEVRRGRVRILGRRPSNDCVSTRRTLTERDVVGIAQRRGDGERRVVDPRRRIAELDDV